MAFTGIDKKYIFIYVIIIILSFVVIGYRQICFDTVKSILIFEYFGLFVSVAVFALTAIHKLKFNNYTNVKKMEFAEFKAIVSDLISTVMDPATFICSVSLLKGLFLTRFYDIKYFAFFSENEITFIWIASFYFLVKSSLEMRTLFSECFIRTLSVQKSEVKVNKQ
jgi:hypothetical protein